MNSETNRFENYFQHLRKISRLGRIYKRLFSSPILFLTARRFGPRIIEVGSGTGSGMLGTFPSRVVGLDINPNAVEYCKQKGLNASLINANGSFPFANAAFDVCVLDNVIEHIAAPQTTLDECSRIVRKNGGMILAVPGIRGFSSDPDHKVFYDEDKLRSLDSRWTMVGLFAGPFFIFSQTLSRSMKNYGLVAIYRKN